LNPQNAGDSAALKVEAKWKNVPKLLFRFVKQAASLAQKHCAAGLTAVSDPTSHGFPVALSVA